VQGLQVFKFAAGVAQAGVACASVGQGGGQITDGKVGEEINEDDGKQDAGGRMAEE